MPEPDAFARPFDNARDIRHDKGLAFANINNAEHRRYGCKVVIRNNRLCLADNGNERGFADVGEAQ